MQWQKPMAETCFCRTGLNHGLNHLWQKLANPDTAALQLPWSFHWGSATSADGFACQEFHSRPVTNVHPTWAGRRHTNCPWHINLNIVLTASDCISGHCAA